MSRVRKCERNWEASKDTDAELASLEQNLPQDVEVVLHDVVGFVDQEHRIDKAKLRIPSDIGTFLQIDHIFVVEVEQQDEDHISFLVSYPERGEIDDRDARKEFVEVLGVRRPSQRRSRGPRRSDRIL